VNLDWPVEDGIADHRNGPAPRLWGLGYYVHAAVTSATL
jgi:hypothetical protein